MPSPTTSDTPLVDSHSTVSRSSTSSYLCTNPQVASKRPVEYFIDIGTKETKTTVFDETQISLVV